MPVPLEFSSLCRLFIARDCHSIMLQAASTDFSASKSAEGWLLLYMLPPFSYAEIVPHML